jgi:hypothetical protein
MRADDRGVVPKQMGRLAAQRRRPEGLAEDEKAARVARGTAWEEFCDRIKAVGKPLLETAVPLSSRDHADLSVYLMGLVSASLQQAMAHHDPTVPRWVRNPDSRCKHSGDNPDNVYLRTCIDPRLTYRLGGHKGGCFDILFEVTEGYMQLGTFRTFETVSLSSLAVAEDGSFEIILSPDQREGNWIPLDPDARLLNVRQYFQDWSNEAPAELRLVAEGGEGVAPRPITAVVVDDLLDEAATWVEGTATFWSSWVEKYHEQYRPAEIAQPEFYAGGVKDILYANSYFKLRDGEALVIEGTPPTARFWQFQLLNNALVSMDFVNHQCSLNGRQIALDADGKFRIIVADRDPGYANWLDACEHQTGLVQYRWIWTRDNPPTTARIVPFDSLAAVLPPGSRRVSPEERRAAIARRQAHVVRREWL